jgi:hypothetical protein
MFLVTFPMAIFLPTTPGALRARALIREKEGKFIECRSCGFQVRTVAAVCWCCRRGVRLPWPITPDIRA